ncbi:SRPBCC family protein [Thermobifida halotolerans]|uniref:SRPBCC family protein n=1 Tax=Thermobifida halotolerans TaxID=483545 RepID=A0A399FXQ8_9ACTN|nr:SRPBCC family protein [Thermobifida halotolerans]UOE18822.1 SRPBCC family protein [Thermobifida halotolerans]
MTTLRRSADLGSPAAEVWALVGDFSAIGRWHPTTPDPVIRGADSPNTPGAERVFGAGTDSALVERLVDRDGAARRLVYTMPDPPFPITGHRATLEVVERDAHHCTVVWTATFDSSEEVARELESAMGDGVFTVGLDALAERYGRG